MRTAVTFANVTSLLALMVALGGTSYAALKVTGRDVVNSSLTGRDVANNSLRGADVRNRSLTARDFARGELPTGAPGPRGPAGPAGTNGAAGPSGPAGPPATRLWANIHASGEVRAAGEPGIRAERSSPGKYTVYFPRRVDACGSQVTVGYPADATGETPHDYRAFAVVEGGAPGPTTFVPIDIRRHDGAQVDASFSIAIFC